MTMIAHRILSIAFVLGLLAPRAAFAIYWVIERNFRYFRYPSDLAAQRAALDLYIAEKGAAPALEELEKLMNGVAFWSTKLGPRPNAARPASGCRFITETTALQVTVFLSTLFNYPIPIARIAAFVGES